MARWLIILTIILSLGTGFLGYQTVEKIKALQEDLKKTKATLRTTQADLTKTKDELKKTNEELTTTKADVETKAKEIATLKGSLDEATKKVADVTAQLEAKTKEAATLADQFEQIKKVFEGVKPEELKAKIDQQAADLMKAQTELAEQKQVNVGLTAQLDSTKASKEKAETTVKTYVDGTVKAGLEGKVLAYNPGWNFVVLSVGDKAGVRANAPLIVKRGNEMIARLRITTVEPATSIADVVPGSTHGKILPGDTVIFTGGK